jgi:hypothetical protein
MGEWVPMRNTARPAKPVDRLFPIPGTTMVVPRLFF